MVRISSIALNTFRESVREKLLYIALLFGGTLLASTYVLSPLAVGARQKIVTDVGLAAVSIIGVLTAILIGGTLVHKEVDKKAVFMVLTRPVSRSEFLIGKFAGLAAAIALLIAIMTAVVALTALMGGTQLRLVVFVAIYLTVLEVMVMCSVVILFSTFTTPMLTSFFSICFFVAGSLSSDLKTFTQKFGGPVITYTMEVVHVLLPNLAVFNLRHEAVHNLHFNGSDVALATAYAVAYCAAALYFAYLIFRRREFV